MEKGLTILIYVSKFTTEKQQHQDWAAFVCVESPVPSHPPGHTSRELFTRLCLSEALLLLPWPVSVPSFTLPPSLNIFLAAQPVWTKPGPHLQHDFVVVGFSWFRNPENASELKRFPCPLLFPKCLGPTLKGGISKVQRPFGLQVFSFYPPLGRESLLFLQAL